MKTFLGLVLATGFALALEPIPATAATYKSYHCHCVPDDGNMCFCELGSYSLCAFCTKEFRGYCDGTNVGTNYGTGNKDFFITGRNKNTTCTANVNAIALYVTRSCTNWSETKKDTISLELRCMND